MLEIITVRHNLFYVLNFKYHFLVSLYVSFPFHRLLQLFNPAAKSCCFYGTSISMATDCEAINTIFNLVWEKEVRLWMKPKAKYLNWKIENNSICHKKADFSCNINCVTVSTICFNYNNLFWVQVIHDLAFWVISSHKITSLVFLFSWQKEDFEDLPIVY